jgi:hypothetical protein
MTYKETLFFIGKCLTINHEKHNKISVEDELKSNHIDWDAVVKVSTGHFVFPALYCNLKRADFLHYLPIDLVEYMKHITDLNRERNQQIIDQAKEINELLLVNNITPIFLKGTGNLLEGLYEDIGERMVGDIDLILSLENVKKADKILKDNKYTSKYTIYDDHRHLARLTKLNKIAAIELHKDFLEIPYRKKFNYFSVKDSILKTENNFTVLGDIDKMAMNIFSNQITDNGYKKGIILLRNYYDFLLISKKCTLNEISQKYPRSKKIILSYWAVNLVIIESVNNCKFKNIKTTNKQTNKQIRKFLWNLNNPKLSNYLIKFKNINIYIQTRSIVFIKAFYKKSNFNFVFTRITSLKWLKEKFKN